MTSCDLLNVDSNRQVSTDEFNMKASNDSLYSMFGIFSKLEKLADSYALLGELRADLIDVNPNSKIVDAYLNEINNNDISSKNTYVAGIKDYYAVINNCNYVIHNIDTSVVNGGVKVMYKEYAACKAIRAWTYMQIALNYGSAIYYDKPILTIEDAESVQKQTPLQIKDLANLLIDDIKPYKDIDKPNFGTLYSFNTTYAFFPIRFILGDLYLWTGDYESAANEYHDLIYKNSYRISNTTRNSWNVVNKAFTGSLSTIWAFAYNSNERITNIAATNAYSHVFKLDSLTYRRDIIPSNVALNNWDSQMYFDSYLPSGDALDTLVDTRKFSFLYSDVSFTKITTNTNNYVGVYMDINQTSTNKAVERQVIVYRVPMLYLRYAEAVNRLGKPNLAFAVLKYGLNNINIQKYVPTSEKSSSANYMNFPNDRFDYYVVDSKGNSVRYTNIGIRMRGCGNVDQDTTYYKIPNLSAKPDSILYVEDLIEQELRLETAFEGNRFHDLMRFAIRRDDNAYLADKIAAKHVGSESSFKAFLMNRANWYLKK